MARWARFSAVALVVRGLEVRGRVVVKVVVKVVGEVDETIKLAKALNNQAGTIMVVASKPKTAVVAKVAERLNPAKVDLVVAEADSAT